MGIQSSTFVQDAASLKTRARRPSWRKQAPGSGPQSTLRDPVEALTQAGAVSSRHLFDAKACRRQLPLGLEFTLASMRSQSFSVRGKMRFAAKIIHKTS